MHIVNEYFKDLNIKPSATIDIVMFDDQRNDVRTFAKLK